MASLLVEELGSNIFRWSMVVEAGMSSLIFMELGMTSTYSLNMGQLWTPPSTHS